MLRNREYTIQGWTNEGPAFTVGSPAAGWRNRHARRAGSKLERQHGPHELLDTKHELEPYEPSAAMLVGDKQAELWAFKAGHVYAVDAIVDDGDVVRIAFDARKDDRIEVFKQGLDLLEWRALRDDELDEYLADGELDQPTNFSDGAESQEPVADAEILPAVEGKDEPITALTGAQTEDPSVEDDDSTPEAPGTDTPGPEAPADPDANEQEAAVDDGVGEPGEVHTPVVEPETEVVAPPAEQTASTDDEDEPSENDFDGTVDQFHELADALTDEELAAYAELDRRKTLREHAAHLLEQRKAQAAAAAAESDPED